MTMIWILFQVFSANSGHKAPSAVPYDLPKFRPVLDSSKLQCPVSSGGYCSVPYGAFDGVSNDHFYLTGEWMTFMMCGNGLRSELRHRREMETNEEALLYARIRLSRSSADEFTFLQVYGKDLRKPLLRLVWRRYRYGTYGHIWAVFRRYHEEGDSLSAEWMDLGKPDSVFDVVISLKNRFLLVYANGRLVGQDISHWKGRLYFKAGVYVQRGGCATTYFDRLYILPYRPK